MPAINDSIKQINTAICRHLDDIENNSRGVISQDILELLTKFTNTIMLKFYANGNDIAITEENIKKATEYAQITDDLFVLYKFKKYLHVVTAQYTLDEDASERLMLKYYKYLKEIKKLVQNYYGLQILDNLYKFPLHLDDSLQDYYSKIAQKIEMHPASIGVEKGDRYYIQNIKQKLIKGNFYYEVTITPANDKNIGFKTNRVIAFTKLPITSNYCSKLHIIHETIEILGMKMPIIIIDGWEISIRNCEFKNFISIISGKKSNVSYKEQQAICSYLTRKQKTLVDIIDYPDYAYEKISENWKIEAKNPVFTPILDYCRYIIKNRLHGQNVIRYLLNNMNNSIIRSQHFSEPHPSLSNLYLRKECIPFDSIPYNRSLFFHNPNVSSLFECIPPENKRQELFARFIKNNTEFRGQLFTDVSELTGYDDFESLIAKYNANLWFGHRPRSDIKYEHNQIFINEYMLDTCNVIRNLQALTEAGIPNYSAEVEAWLLFDDYIIDCAEKKDMIGKIFSKSKVAVIYGSAGVGKSTLINHISNFYNSSDKLFLTQTNTAKENLERKINADNCCFLTISSYLQSKMIQTEYEMLVIDECSTVSNSDMVKILEKTTFNTILLVGDPYQINSIKFGNWFSVLNEFLPNYAVFELKSPHRTKDQYLLELWEKVRYMDDTTKEILEKESCSLKVDTTLLSTINKDEVVLCLNYDGLYGINNINKFLQESNPNPAVQWDIHHYKIGDPILFLESDRFHSVLHNNLKGTIQDIQILDVGELEERIQFDIEVEKLLSDRDVRFSDVTLLSNSPDGKSLVRFSVYKLKSTDEDDDDYLSSRTIIPFQIAYALSIHKAQGLEYKSVKLVITDEVEDLVTHNIFYTAITRATEKLKIYWTPEIEEKILNRIKPRDISRDVEILKKYLN